MGDILTLARADLKFILSEGGFETDVTFEKGVTSVTVQAIAMKHHLSFDFEGKPINSQQSHVTVDESVLIDASFPTRNAKNEADMINTKITYTDSTGVAGTYKVVQQFPDETLGLISLMLSRYE